MPDSLAPDSGSFFNNLAAGTKLGGPSSLQQLSDQDQENQRRLLQQLALYNQQYNDAYQRQSAASRGFDSVINGTAPSVAQTQLQQGVGQIAQQQLAQASGATGQNAAIARIAAMQNTGAAQAQANQAAAVQRAMEIDQARRAKAAISGQQAGEAGSMYGANLSGAVGFSSPAVTASGQDAAIKQKEEEANRAFWSNIIKAGGSAIAAGASA
jgi:hypothetical protein